MKRTLIFALILLVAGCASRQAPPEKPASTPGTEEIEIREDRSPTKPVPPLKQKAEAKVVQPGPLPVTVTVPKQIPDQTRESKERDLQRQAAVEHLCDEIGNKLGSVSVADCDRQALKYSAATPMSRTLAYKTYPPVAGRKPLGKVLFIAGIHGDEFSAVSVTFKWMEILNQHHSGLFEWRFIPLANPDGLLAKKSQRQNSNGVDLNRNFPSADWNTSAHQYWVETTARNPRRHPGSSKASEVETQWLVEQIKQFKPDVIISMHAPHHLVDYDGPPKAPEKLGKLSLSELGVYPGSLGNYAGHDLQLPVVTVELPSAGIMPPKSEINQMWLDLVQWLREQLEHRKQDAASRQTSPE